MFLTTEKIADDVSTGVAVFSVGYLWRLHRLFYLLSFPFVFGFRPTHIILASIPSHYFFVLVLAIFAIAMCRAACSSVIGNEIAFLNFIAIAPPPLISICIVTGYAIWHERFHLSSLEVAHSPLWGLEFRETVVIR